MDIAKDTLYIQHKEDNGRRSIQTVMYEVLVALTKLVAPILPHTADEVWPFIPGVKTESVQLTDMPEEDALVYDEAIEKKWDQVLELRDDVLKALENARNEKIIGKSLTAAISLYPNDTVNDVLSSIKGLEKLFIVSKAVIAGDKQSAPKEAQHFDSIAIVVEKAAGETCERCWVVSETVGQDETHPTLCSSCADIVKNHY